MRFVFVVRFKENGRVKAFKTTANSPGDAAKKMHRSGRILSVKKFKKANAK